MKLALGLAAVVLVAIGLPPARLPSAAASVHHAALIVDTSGMGGTSGKTVCVGFSTDSITGRQLLERAGVDPVFADYGGQGSAVCMLCGVGCSSDRCLTCDPKNYWAYFRAPAGAQGFSYSSVGAGSTTVHDGDVDGWRWGSGRAPAFQSFDSICGAPSATTTVGDPTTLASPTTSPPTTAGPTTTTRPGAPTTTGTTGTTGTIIGSATTTTAAAGPGATPTSARRDDDADAQAAAPAAARSGAADDTVGGSPLRSVAGLTVAIAAIALLAVLARRRRVP